MSVNVVGTLVVFVVLEVLTRAVGLHAPTMQQLAGTDRHLWIYDQTKGWFHRPHMKGRVYYGGPDKGLVQINSLGLRGGEFGVPKPPGRRRVLVFGDSFVFGVGVDEEHLFTTHLQRLLRLTGGDVDVINMGVSGYSTDQELVLMRETGSRLSPDLVILAICDNDFEGNLLDFVYGRYYKPRFRRQGGSVIPEHRSVPRLSGLELGKLWLAERSNLWNLLRTVPFVKPALEVGQASRSEDDSLALMVALVREFKRTADSLGTQLLVMNTGHRGEHTELFHPLRPALSVYGIRSVGLEPAFGRARKEQADRAWDFVDDTHWNVESHLLAARVVHSDLLISKW